MYVLFRVASNKKMPLFSTLFTVFNYESPGQPAKIEIEQDTPNSGAYF
jgi:hypothetical protein